MIRCLVSCWLNINFKFTSKILSLYWCWWVSWCCHCRFIARPCAMGLKIQANGPQKAQPNAILEKVFTAITKVLQVILCYFKRCVSSHSICATVKVTRNTWRFYLVSPASRWEEVGGPVQAARLGRADHPALVQTTSQPGEAQYSRPILRKHVRQITLNTKSYSTPNLAASHFSLHVIPSRFVKRRTCKDF